MDLDKEQIRLAEIYPTFNGEQNQFGIGSPTIFVRLAGCHLRCYLKTKGTLCDTPQFLQGTSGDATSVAKIIKEVNKVRADTGIDLICLSGGDPLSRSTEQVSTLLAELVKESFFVTIETSGTISIKPIKEALERDEDYYVQTSHASGTISFILDYKLPSAGIKIKNTVDEDLSVLTDKDYIKFVVEGEEDYYSMKRVLDRITSRTFAKLTAGCYWGGSITPFDLFNRLKNDKLTGSITMNFQVHKMALASDYTVETNSKQI